MQSQQLDPVLIYFHLFVIHFQLYHMKSIHRIFKNSLGLYYFVKGIDVICDEKVLFGGKRFFDDHPLYYYKKNVLEKNTNLHDIWGYKFL